MILKPSSFQSINYRRILLHILFWIVVLAALTVIFGVNKSFIVAFRNNFFYLPIHIIYFYFIAYYLIPKFLLRDRFVLFGIGLLIIVVFATFLARCVDFLFVDPYVEKVQKEMGLVLVWEKTQGTFLQQMQKGNYFINAFKGINLVVWIAIAIKFFKMWYEKKQAALYAELNFLKGQVHPHFLFNTLNNLYALTLQQSPKAPQVVMGLSEILRYMLYECDKDVVELKKEVQILESYIALEKMRYEERLDLNFIISGELKEQKIAPLLLICLVENAFKHGISEQIGDSWIKIDLSIQEHFLKFKVANSKAEVKSLTSKHHGNIGLTNLVKRLDILYPDGHTLKIEEDDDLFLAILELDLSKRVNI